MRLCRYRLILWYCLIIGAHSESNGSTGKQKRKVRVQNVQIDEGTNIWIYDGALTQKEVSAILEYASVPSSDYRFLQRDFDYVLTNGLTPFISSLNDTELTESKFQTIIKNLVKRSVNTEVELKNIFVEFLHSLDPKPPVKEFCHEDVFYATAFLVDSWGHNMYGQLSFYTLSANKNISAIEREEIVHTVHPKPGRIVVWPSCALHSSHPPPVNYFGNLPMLRLVFVKSEAADEAREIHHDWLSFQPSGEPSLMGWTFNNADANREIDYAKHLKRMYFDRYKRGIYVFDDLYTPEELKQFTKVLLDAGDIRTSLFDGYALEDNDNVQWIAVYNVDEFMVTPVWKRLQELLLHITNDTSWYPYDVALNLIRPADHTRIHADAEDHQDEYTYLLYLNENTTEADLGETVFFEREWRKNDGIHEFTNPGGEELEPIAAVRPKYGRVVIFQNNIKHSARPFSTSHLSCRYTFACKVSRSERLSLIKLIYEKMDISLDHLKAEKYKDLARELATGLHDDPAKSYLTLQQLQEMMSVIKSELMKESKTHRAGIISGI